MLCIFGETVKTHLQSIFCKLNVPDRTAAVVQALRLGLVDLFAEVPTISKSFASAGKPRNSGLLHEFIASLL